jgi:hypothetical protein
VPTYGNVLSPQQYNPGMASTAAGCITLLPLLPAA